MEGEGGPQLVKTRQALWDLIQLPKFLSHFVVGDTEAQREVPYLASGRKANLGTFPWSTGVWSLGFIGNQPSSHFLLIESSVHAYCTLSLDQLLMIFL